MHMHRYLTRVLHSHDNARYVFGGAAVLSLASLVLFDRVASYLVNKQPQKKTTTMTTPVHVESDSESDDDTNEQTTTTTMANSNKNNNKKGKGNTHED